MRRLLLPVVLAALCLLSCDRARPTQVLVTFEADEPLRTSAQRLRIEVENQNGEMRAWDLSFRDDDPEGTTFPITVPLVPRDGDPSRTYEVYAQLFGAGSTVLAEAAARSGYVADELRELPIRFEAACAGQVCGRGRTCVEGRCQNACMEPGALGAPPIRCGGLDATGCDDEHRDALFCDGFESQELDGWDRAASDQGEVMRTTQSYRGEGALRVATLANRGNAYVSTAAVEGIDSGDLFVRAYLRVPEPEVLVAINFFFAGEFTVFDGLLVGLRNDAAYVRSSPLPGMSESMPLRRGRWLCVEGRISMGAFGQGSVELWVEGTSVGEVAGLSNSPTTPFTLLNLGIPLSEETQPPLELFVDEVVVDTERIGCD